MLLRPKIASTKRNQALFDKLAGKDQMSTKRLLAMHEVKNFGKLFNASSEEYLRGH